MTYKKLGKTGLDIPPIIFGTSCLGNLYQPLSREIKLDILREMFNNMSGLVLLDSAGKYGAGLALEVIGQGLQELDIPAKRIVISNKMGWYRVPLTTPEPTFERGVWANIKHDAIQKISYDGIYECWEQGCQLLGENYSPRLLSVHDPDEYLAAATTPRERSRAFQDIIDAYRALFELKEQGLAKAIGVGAKDWHVIRDITSEIDLDWVMLAVSFTILKHPPEVLDFLDELTERGIGIFNSAVFHAGFLTGGRYFDYRILNPRSETDKTYFDWRKKFFSVCQDFAAAPATACVQFGLSHPGILSIALNTSNPQRVRQNIASVSTELSSDFWMAMKNAGLIANNYPYLGQVVQK
ncbi:aldo/keto reductase [candidate division KSB1 bacterium]|nr:aldo/keto reductase [candidate division KSB1 bacterium]RQW06893.1 MAG: aldo/keto reductase [candidate division KSB1 bacterium]